MAYLLTTDASGQDAEQGILDAAALPENKGIEIVDKEHFGVADISISAQLAKIKAVRTRRVARWATGTAGSTRAARHARCRHDLPVLPHRGT